MWFEQHHPVRIIVVLICASLIYGVTAFGDFLVYIASRYIFQAESFFTPVLAFWRFAFFLVVAAWIYRETR